MRLGNTCPQQIWHQAGRRLLQRPSTHDPTSTKVQCKWSMLLTDRSDPDRRYHPPQITWPTAQHTQKEGKCRIWDHRKTVRHKKWDISQLDNLHVKTTGTIQPTRTCTASIQYTNKNSLEKDHQGSCQKILEWTFTRESERKVNSKIHKHWRMYPRLSPPTCKTP